MRLFLIGLALAPFALLLAAPAFADEFDDDVLVQLEELGSANAVDRRAAEAALVELAGEAPDNAERVLAQLPAANASIPAEVLAAIERVRIRIQRDVARRATAASTVTIEAIQQPIGEVLEEFTRQTGAKFHDQREAFGNNAPPILVTLSLTEEPFWQAIDKLLDEADLSVYPYGEEGEVTLVPREEGTRLRSRGAVYAGPFRFEPLSLAATRGLRDDSASRLDLVIEAAWEPRLRPIAIVQALRDVTVTGSDGKPLLPRMPDQTIAMEASPGEQALTLTLSMQLPGRDVRRIESVAGQLTAMIPATRREFRFEKIGAAKFPIVQTFGGAAVTVTRFRKANDIWELHMRLRLDNAGDSLASHRGWVFQNPSYLLDAEGKRYDQVGFETTMQSQNEVGLAYLFDLGDGELFDDEPADDKEPKLNPEVLTWVYETPTGVYTAPISWKLGPLELP
ncbi:hypothetical protein [Botrimarina mediterranea]|uniref:Uncharacterized protein n=1 Tax=Botrimarina mediterranea TaxID=2528022 RepID=A0A518K4W7_9BACT|nr:hypothetical protein [Botrimarina mediterranea]QDV72838.1 hypothetical protein Spa11_10200 [Botrimarina mediterranea]QDV77410.1 hypothetical protein K2D_10010 [Planctomycetes bacterium K2D]